MKIWFAALAAMASCFGWIAHPALSATADLLGEAVEASQLPQTIQNVRSNLGAPTADGEAGGSHQSSLELESGSIPSLRYAQSSGSRVAFVDVTVQGRTIPVCSDANAQLERNAFNDTLQIGNYAIEHWGREHLGRISGLGITCKVMEFGTARANSLDFTLVWTDFLDTFGGTFGLIEGRHGGPYALYRLVYPDNYVQYLATYFQPSGAIVLSVGSGPDQVDLTRQTLVLMMGESGLHRPGVE